MLDGLTPVASGPCHIVPVFFYIVISDFLCAFGMLSCLAWLIELGMLILLENFA